MPFEDFSVERLSGRTPPARSYLWTIDLTPPGTLPDPSLLTLQARTVSIPSMTDDEIEIPYMNSRFWIAGRRNWDTIDIQFMENEKGDIYQIFYDWKSKIYDVENFGTGGVPLDYKSRIDITKLTVKGEAIDEFILQGAWPSVLQNVDLDYGSDEVLLVSVTFRFDYWIRNPKKAKLQATGVPSPGQLQAPGITI